MFACLVAAGLATSASGASGRPAGIHLIRHVVVIMQENRSFDSYFGTYPGADGIPKGVCVPVPRGGGCVRPYHDTSNRNAGGPHDHVNAVRDIDAGNMDGFVLQAASGRRAIQVGRCKHNRAMFNCRPRRISLTRLNSLDSYAVSRNSAQGRISPSMYPKTKSPTASVLASGV